MLTMLDPAMSFLRYILSWWKPQRGDAAPALKVILYTRAGCHLCEDALQMLNDERRRCNFELEIIDVDGEAGLRERYGECVPVVVVDGKVYFRGRVNQVMLRRLLEGKALSRKRR